MGGEVPEPRWLHRALSSGCGGVPEEALHLVLGCIDDPRDRAAASLVCHRWHRIDALTRKHVTVGFCYAAEPARLRTRFPRLESLAIKGRPRAAMYGLIPEDWGAYAEPWIAELAAPLDCLKAVHLRRMTVTDHDIAVLVRARGHMLQVLKLDKCSGFSTDALRLVARSCRSLRTLFLEECEITNNGSEWLHDLAVSNSVLMTLNFYMTELKVEPADLELLAKNCKSLISLKTSECDLSDLIGFFQTSKALEEFAGGAFYDEVGEYTKNEKVKFPPRLCLLGLTYMGTNEMSVIFPFSATLKKLDLQYTFLTTEDHCQLISKCPNLLVLEVRNVIGDRGLEVVANTCKKLQRLRIERGDDDPGQEEPGRVSQIGLTAIAVGCRELEYIAAYVSDITNGALESIGTFCKNLYDFRVVLLDREREITDLPLDNGVRALLRNCTKLRRFALYLRQGGLSDAGLGYIGQYSGNIQYMLLGNVGESDDGLINFAMGCKNLRNLELRSCCFSESALAIAVLQMPSLRYIWVQGYRASATGQDLLLMARPFWNIEFVPPSPQSSYEQTADGLPCVDTQAMVLAYYSLAGPRSDCPQWLVPLHPARRDETRSSHRAMASPSPSSSPLHPHQHQHPRPLSSHPQFPAPPPSMPPPPPPAVPPKALDLELTVVSGKHLKNINWRRGDLRAYVVAYLDPSRRSATRPDDAGGCKPTWNERLVLPLPPHLSPHDPSLLLSLDVFHSKPSDSPKPLVGSTRSPIRDLIFPPNRHDSTDSPIVTLPLLRPSGRPQGKLRIRVAIRERSPPPPEPQYPPPSSSPYYFPPPPPPVYSAPPQYGSDPYYRRPSGYYSAPPPPPQYEYTGGPSAPAEYSRPYDQRGRSGLGSGSGRYGVGTGLAVGAAAGALGALAIDEGVKYKEKAAERVEEKVVPAPRDDYSEYRGDY